MLLTKEAMIKWNSFTKNYYVQKGYIFTKMNDQFLAKIEDVQLNSHVKIEYKCDYCNKSVKTDYKTYNTNNNKSPLKKDACGDCKSLKVKESNLLVYGTEDVINSPKIRKKVENILINKTGFSSSFKNPDVLRKAKKTMVIKYGAPNAQQVKSIREKTYKTNIKRYGKKHPSQNDEIKKKSMMTLMNNGTAPTSKQQLQINELLHGKLNYVVGKSFLDIAFPNDKIYLEYDGGGHNLQVKLGKLSQDEFDSKERRRFFALLSQNWKCVRMICPNDKLPSDKVILTFWGKSKELILKHDTIKSIRWFCEEDYILLTGKVKYSLDEFLELEVINDEFIVGNTK